LQNDFRPSLNEFTDLRSDTLTKPTPEMLRAMINAQVGDHFYNEDPTVLKLESTIAQYFGFESGAFFPTATMANQVALKLNARPGDAVIGDPRLHIVQFETGALACLGGLNFIPSQYPYCAKEIEENYSFLPSLYAPQVKTLCFENTFLKQSGAIWPENKIEEMCSFAQKLNLNTHCDGARIWHAVTEEKATPHLQGSFFNTLTVCFSKALGAPAGSLLLTKNSDSFRVQQLRKMHGGTMRQSGFLAAAALYAFENHFKDLKQDHENAKNFFSFMMQNFSQFLDVKKIEHLGYAPQTNIVFIDCLNSEKLLQLENILKSDFKIKLSKMTSVQLRAVFHRDARGFR
jgi:threonine aldolase